MAPDEHLPSVDELDERMDKLAEAIIGTWFRDVKAAQDASPEFKRAMVNAFGPVMVVDWNTMTARHRGKFRQILKEKAQAVQAPQEGGGFHFQVGL